MILFLSPSWLQSYDLESHYIFYDFHDFDNHSARPTGEMGLFSQNQSMVWLEKKIEFSCAERMPWYLFATIKKC